MSANTIELIVQRLSSADSGTAPSNRLVHMLTPSPTDVKVKVEAATQLRDNLEHYISGPIYPAFLKKLVPIFINCLNGPPVFVSTSAEQVRISLGLYSRILIYGAIETAQLRSRDPPPPTHKPARALRAICGGSCRPVNKLGQN
jgi:hypothetical protein